MHALQHAWCVTLCCTCLLIHNIHRCQLCAGDVSALHESFLYSDITDMKMIGMLHVLHARHAVPCIIRYHMNHISTAHANLSYTYETSARTPYCVYL